MQNANLVEDTLGVGYLRVSAERITLPDGTKVARSTVRSVRLVNDLVSEHALKELLIGIGLLALGAWQLIGGATPLSGSPIVAVALGAILAVYGMRYGTILVLNTDQGELRIRAGVRLSVVDRLRVVTELCELGWPAYHDRA